MSITGMVMAGLKLMDSDLDSVRSELGCGADFRGPDAIRRIEWRPRKSAPRSKSGPRRALESQLSGPNPKFGPDVDSHRQRRAIEVPLSYRPGQSRAT